MRKKGNLVIAIPTKFEAMGISDENIPLIITGVGKKSLNAIDIIHKKFKEPFIVLIGFCGCRNKEIPYGKAFIINKSICGNDEITLDDDTSFCKELERATITTLSKYGSGDLVDMESFWIAQKCKELGLKLRIIRIVSDHCDMDEKLLMDVFKFKTKELPEGLKKAKEVLLKICSYLAITILLYIA